MDFNFPPDSPVIPMILISNSFARFAAANMFGLLPLVE
jgi:hypothetical protein